MTNTLVKSTKMLGKILIVLVGLSFLAIASDVAYSYITVSGNILSDTTWGPNQTYYVTGNITVAAGVTLTIEQGTVVKITTLKPRKKIVVLGTLDVNGVDGDNVIFTSMDDDSCGEIIQGSDGIPEPGDWQKIQVDGTGQFDWCIIRYGGEGSGNPNLLFNGSGPGSFFNNSICEYSACYGVYIRNCSPTFRGSTIAHNSSYGVYITGNGANPDFGHNPDPGNNTFQDNGQYHLYNDTSNTIMAIGNTWIPPGSIYGPTMVVFSSFAAVTEDDKVILAWRTESEVNNAGFAIYRSETKDGIYTKISFVPGAEDSETSRDYRFADEHVELGHTYYYYLEGIALSGKRTKTDVIQITLTKTLRSRKPKLLSDVQNFPTQTEPSNLKREILPRQNSLLANYPNPSNPETWFPYSLAKAADVTIRIYNIQGHLVRTLYLGHQPAGFYLSKNKAAYWDGLDDTGERVSSGVYFYCLSTGNFSAVRKMVILK